MLHLSDPQFAYIEISLISLLVWYMHWIEREVKKIDKLMSTRSKLTSEYVAQEVAKAKSGPLASDCTYHPRQGVTPHSVPSPYAGMGYEQASKEAIRLIREAGNTGNWFPIVDKLVTLKGLAERDQQVRMKSGSRR